MAVVAVHPNAASLELHLRVGGPEFRKVGEFIVLRAIEVFVVLGEELLVDETAMDRLRSAFGLAAQQPILFPFEFVQHRVR